MIAREGNPDGLIVGTAAPHAVFRSVLVHAGFFSGGLNVCEEVII